jgi:hypothetical protein
LIRLRCGCEACDGTIDGEVPGKGGPVACANCGKSATAASPESFAPGGVIGHCAVCPSDELYLQRDFPRRAGMFVMISGAVIFLMLAGWRENIIAGFAVLGGVALLDFLLFRFLPVVTVCYRCRAELRGLAPNPEHKGFDHHVAEEALKRAAVDRANART